jgi:predicted CoA-binding protein
MNEPEVMERMLRESKIIAVVGMSNKDTRASYHIGKYLARNGYRVVPVNPTLQAIDGVPCYPDLESAQAALQAEGGKGIDLVDVFRAPEHVPEIVDDVIRLGIKSLWLQDGVMHQSMEKAEAAGVQCVQNDCIFRRHAALG